MQVDVATLDAWASGPMQAGVSAPRFPLDHLAVAAVIPGARLVGELTRNVALMRHPVPAALWSDLKAEGLLRADAPVPDDTPGEEP